MNAYVVTIFLLNSPFTRSFVILKSDIHCTRWKKKNWLGQSSGLNEIKSDKKKKCKIASLDNNNKKRKGKLNGTVAKDFRMCAKLNKLTIHSTDLVFVKLNKIKRNMWMICVCDVNTMEKQQCALSHQKSFHDWI